MLTFWATGSDNTYILVLEALNCREKSSGKEYITQTEPLFLQMLMLRGEKQKVT